MDQSICRGCLNALSADSIVKNMFIDHLKLNLEHKSFTEDMKICIAMELITGEKVLRSNNNVPDILCEACCIQLETCINFRMQLLNSFRTLLKSSPSQATDSSVDSAICSQTDVKSNGFPSTNMMNNVNTSDARFPTEDWINVDESSTSSNNSIGDDSNHSLEDVQDNNNFNAEDSSNVDVDADSPKEYLPKSLDNDLESDIDVCSGEDDEILELDGHNIKNEVGQFENSSDSDIEVCDYEPVGKRIRV